MAVPDADPGDPAPAEHQQNTKQSKRRAAGKPIPCGAARPLRVEPVRIGLGPLRLGIGPAPEILAEPGNAQPCPPRDGSPARGPGAGGTEANRAPAAARPRA